MIRNRVSATLAAAEKAIIGLVKNHPSIREEDKPPVDRAQARRDFDAATAALADARAKGEARQKELDLATAAAHRAFLVAKETLDRAVMQARIVNQGFEQRVERAEAILRDTADPRLGSFFSLCVKLRDAVNGLESRSTIDIRRLPAEFPKELRDRKKLISALTKTAREAETRKMQPGDHSKWIEETALTLRLDILADAAEKYHSGPQS